MRSRVFSLFLLILVMSSLVSSSCRKREVYPDEPVISFYSFTKINSGLGYDNKAILNISFTDGDGDIGLKDEDTLAPYNIDGDYYYNMLISYFEKQNGTYVKVDLPVENNYRIPYFEADLAELGIKGNIEVELFINNVVSDYDTIKFSCYIYDRALNKSNTVETPEIVIDKN